MVAVHQHGAAPAALKASSVLQSCPGKVSDISFNSLELDGNKGMERRICKELQAAFEFGATLSAADSPDAAYNKERKQWRNLHFDCMKSNLEGFSKCTTGL